MLYIIYLCVYIHIYLFIYLGFSFTIVLYVCYLLWNDFMCILMYMIMCMLLSATSTHFKWELMLYCLHCPTLNKVFLLLLLFWVCVVWRSGSSMELSALCGLMLKPYIWLITNRSFFYVLGTFKFKKYFIISSWARHACVDSWINSVVFHKYAFANNKMVHSNLSNKSVCQLDDFYMLIKCFSKGKHARKCISSSCTGIISCMRPANERRLYNIMPNTTVEFLELLDLRVHKEFGTHTSSQL